MSLRRVLTIACVAALAAAAPVRGAAAGDVAPSREVAPGPDAAPGRDAAPGARDAIERAVRERMGQDVTVRVSDLRLDRMPPTEGLQAMPDPGARTGRPVRFTLIGGGRRVGGAVARIDVSAPHVRARHAVDRDAALVAADLETVDGDVLSVRFDPLPGPAEAAGQRVRRAVAAGEVITSAVIHVPDAVRTGDEVRARVRVGAIEAWGAGRAWGSGRVGDVIRITRGTARTTLRARIVAPGIVEILQ